MAITHKYLNDEAGKYLKNISLKKSFPSRFHNVSQKILDSSISTGNSYSEMSYWMVQNRNFS